ncbi:hypothetical protein DXG01_005399 [Tephrocybe rancida]|nr:hypothetical protein DXG01_005399 [Tephrocybe rancida]
MHGGYLDIYGDAHFVDVEIHTERELLRLIKTEGWENIVDLVSNHRVGLLRTEKEYEVVKADYDAAKAAGADLIAHLYGSPYQAYRHPGNNLWPLKLVTQLYKLARKLNPELKLYTNTPVTSIFQTVPSGRKWSLSTPRGIIQCNYVIHATNAYASHLLSHMHGPKGIVPTRAQIIALRTAASSTEITKDGWLGTLGWKYWFPRPVSSPDENPLVILGGARDEIGPGLESYVVDDSTLNEDVGKALRRYLPPLFPGKYEEGREPEMEWVGPVVDASKPADYYKGQYMAAGFTGHGMPRAYAWVFSAEAVAGMLIAELAGEKWVAPEWFPRHFLTTERL